ncbi:MAG: MFS transporter [Candidatus Marinimicrobia bacterium CG1_02_48_14]|nr:MAG: MFS transporter [Candidatus Marinimicrobia bacterium CG1_02_48_14]
MAARDEFRVYGYRWIVLVAYMAIVALNQLLWITFAPVTVEAAKFYGVSDLYIGLLSMSFMIVYIVVSIPASWAIDTWGIRIAVGIGAALTGIFGLMRGLVSDNYTLAMIAQVGIAVGQPFILNAVTTVAARWFPMRERATAVGLGSLAIYLGILGGVALTPWLTIQYGFSEMLWVYGVASIGAAIIFFVFGKERPASPPCPPELEARSLVFDGLKQIMHQKDFILLLVIFFVGLGVFNAVTTWIEDILRPRGFSITQAGAVGGMMIGGGILGAIIFPLLSDYYRKRKPFIILALMGATVGLMGVAYGPGFTVVSLGAFLLGFSLLSAGPIGFQYGAEATYPTPEGTSNGLLILMGQISGIIFIFGMDAFKSPKTGDMTASLTVLIILMVLSALLSLRLKEPDTLLTEELKEE